MLSSLWFKPMNHTIWDRAAEFPTGLHISPELRVQWGMYPACFLRLWMTSESLPDSHGLILWTLRENCFAKTYTINKNIPLTWQKPTGLFALKDWFNSAVFTSIGMIFRLLKAGLRPNVILLWEHWNMKLYKQTGSWQCGGAWEVRELALILQP